MPNIRERADTALDFRPTEVGIESTAAAARRSGAFFNQAAGAMDALGHRASSAISAAGDVAVKYLDHQEISRGAAAGAQLLENLSKSWEQAAKQGDPNDPSHAGKWREETLEPALDQFKAGFNTENSQKFAEQFVERTRSHMFHKTAGDMSALAADAVHINTLKTIHSLGNGLTSDPSSLDFSRATLKASLDGLVESSPNLTAVQAAKVRTDLLFKGEEHLTKQAITGVILKGGDWQRMARDPKNAPFINANEMIQFERAARAQQKSELLTQRQLERYGHQQMTLAAEQGLGKAWNDNVSFDDDGNPTIKPSLFKQIMEVNRQTEGVATPRAEAMINWAQSKQREKKEVIVNNPQIQSALYDGLFRTENPTTDTDILKAAANPDPKQRIDAHTTSTLMGLYKALEDRPLKGRAYQAAMDAVKEKLGTSIVGDGHERYNTFMGQFIPAYLALSEKERIGALDTTNPDSLVSKIIGSEPGKGLRPSQAQMMMGRYLKNLGMGSELPAGGLQELEDKLKGKPSVNLTGPGKGVISETVHDVPAGMSLSDAVKKFGSGAKVKIPSGPHAGKTWTIP